MTRGQRSVLIVGIPLAGVLGPGTSVLSYGWVSISKRLENSRRITADGAGRSKLENALNPLIDSSFESRVSPLIPCLQPLLINAM
jgi:hypothetical protein